MYSADCNRSGGGFYTNVQAKRSICSLLKSATFLIQTEGFGPKSYFFGISRFSRGWLILPSSNHPPILHSSSLHFRPTRLGHDRARHRLAILLLLVLLRLAVLPRRRRCLLHPRLGLRNPRFRQTRQDKRNLAPRRRIGKTM